MTSKAAKEPRANQSDSLTPAGFFVARTPLLPFSAFWEWADDAAVPTTAADLETALGAAREQLRVRLRALLARPEVREALYLASPSLDAHLPAWHTAPDGEQGQKVERALVRYVSRMAGRATPFGLFAGCSVGTLGAETRLEVAPMAAWRRHTRPDGDYLWTLCRAIERDRDLRRAFVHRPSSSLGPLGRRLRYIAASDEGGERSYRFRAIDVDDAVKAALTHARAGVDLHTLAATLAERSGIAGVGREEWADFLDQLVDNAVLVSDLTPQVTGAEPLHDLIAQLERLPATRATAARLGELRAALEALDRAPIGLAPEHYRSIVRGLGELPEEAAKVDPARLLQIDLVKPAPELSLGPEAIAEIKRAYDVLCRVGAADDDPRLRSFRDAFLERYGEREVPLLVALDDELGVGFDKESVREAGGLVADLPLGEAGETPEAWRKLDGLMLRKLTEALRTGAGEICLEPADLAQIPAPDAPAPPGSVAAWGMLAARSPADFAAGDFLLLLSGFAEPGGFMFGRFCHVDGAIDAHVRAYLRAEEAALAAASSDGAPLFAEVVHLPKGRVANVIARPQLRDYEICYLGRSGAPLDRQLGLDDLLVSVKDDRVVLRSQRLGREVRAFLTNAHNHWDEGNLAGYRFLCALERQHARAGAFDWGLLGEAPYLPRVRCGRVVLCLARWTLSRAEVGVLRGGSVAERHRRLRELRQRRGLPRWVALYNEDHSLPIDLDNVLCVDAFLQALKPDGEVTLTELFEPERLCASNPEGRFVHELLVPFVRGAQDPQPAATAAPAASKTVRKPARALAPPRTLLPGSEWLYAKLYTGAHGADRLLREALAPVIAGALAAGAADRWFFIRYQDPDFHLRLRFHGDPERLRGEVQPALEAAAHQALAGEQLWKLQFDSYEREVERYGGDEAIVIAERIFQADSHALLDILHALPSDPGAEARWRLTLLGMDRLLDDLGFDLAGRHQVVAHCRDGFALEHGLGAAGERALGARFRHERALLDALLDGTSPTPELTAHLQRLAPGVAAFRARSRAVRPLGRMLRTRAAKGRLTHPLHEIAASHLHMHANRMLPSAARQHELVLYDFLTRLYQSRLVRSRQPGAAGTGLAS